MNNTAAATDDVAIRICTPDDLRFVVSSWKESHKDSPGCDRMPWPVYKQTTCKQIDALVASARILTALAPDGRVLGWLCYTPGRSISTVHWIYTRHRLDAEPMRRRGVMTALLEAAQLGRRFAYTLRGPRHRASGRRTGRGPSMDLPIVEWLRGRGITAVYVPLEEWLS